MAKTKATKSHKGKKASHASKKASPKPSSPKPHHSTKASPRLSAAHEHKIVNPHSNRKVKATGAIGKAILATRKAC